MLQRGVEAIEVFNLLLKAQACLAQANGRWRVTGQALTVVVELIEDAVVVTLFRGDEDDEDKDEEA